MSDIVDGLGEDEPALCGHALVELAKAFRQRNTNLFHEASKFVMIFDKLIGVSFSVIQSAEIYMLIISI